MIPITANVKFQVPCERFSLQSTTDTQLYLSLDGTNWTAFDDPFNGTLVYCDNPRGLFLKVDNDVMLSY